MNPERLLALLLSVGCLLYIITLCVNHNDTYMNVILCTKILNILVYLQAHGKKAYISISGKAVITFIKKLIIVMTKFGR